MAQEVTAAARGAGAGDGPPGSRAEHAARAGRDPGAGDGAGVAGAPQGAAARGLSAAVDLAVGRGAAVDPARAGTISARHPTRDPPRAGDGGRAGQRSPAIEHAGVRAIARAAGGRALGARLRDRSGRPEPGPHSPRSRARVGSPGRTAAGAAGIGIGIGAATARARVAGGIRRTDRRRPATVVGAEPDTTFVPGPTITDDDDDDATSAAVTTLGERDRPGRGARTRFARALRPTRSSAGRVAWPTAHEPARSIPRASARARGRRAGPAEREARPIDLAAHRRPDHGQRPQNHRPATRQCAESPCHSAYSLRVPVACQSRTRVLA
jgi:hypothetical protein